MENDGPYDGEPMEIENYSEFSILSFPNEILKNIISYLDLKSYKNLSQTCGHFYNQMPMPKLVMYCKKLVCPQIHVLPNNSGKKKYNLNLKYCDKNEYRNPNTIKTLPNSTYLLVGYGNGKFRIWNWKTKQLLRECEAYKNNTIDTIEVSNDGTFFVTAGSSKSVKLWNPQTLQCFKRLKKGRGHIGKICISANNKLIVIAFGTEILSWNLEKNTQEPQLFNAEHNNIISAITISPDSNFVVSGDNNGTVKLWNIENGELLHSWNRPIKESVKVSCLKFSDDGKTIHGTFTPYPCPSKNCYIFKILLG